MANTAKVSLLKDAFKEWRADKASQHAAAMAFYTMLSIAPLLLVIIGIAGLVYGSKQAQQALVGQMQQVVGEQNAQTLQGIIQKASNPTSGKLAAIIGVATLLLGAIGVMSHLQETLNIIWNVDKKERGGLMGVILSRLASFLIILLAGLVLVFLIVAGAVLSSAGKFMSEILPGSDILWQLLNILVSFSAITLVIAIIFKFLPDRKIRWKDVWAGAAFTALLITIGKILLGFYLGRSGVGSVYGAAGSVVVLLVWIYYTAQIFFYGAEFTQVLAERKRRPIQSAA